MSDENYGEDNYIQCACVHCGWTDGFLAEVVERDGNIIGFCDACGQEHEFAPVVNLINRLSATQAELDGADKVIANLKAEREELRQCLDAFLTTKRDNAHWIDKALAILSK